MMAPRVVEMPSVQVVSFRSRDGLSLAGAEARIQERFTNGGEELPVGVAEASCPTCSLELSGPFPGLNLFASGKQIAVARLRRLVLEVSAAILAHALFDSRDFGFDGCAGLIALLDPPGGRLSGE